MSHSHDSHAHAAGDPHAAPDPHEIEHIRQHVKKYWVVGGLLLAFTAITVWLSYFDLGKWNMIVGMIVAAFKAGLVAAIFMHLISERWTIYRFLLITAFFVTGLFLLTFFAYDDPIRVFFHH
jgi:caa(3)-type oxidase subunit IV